MKNMINKASQVNIFEMLSPPYRIYKKIRLIELFAGVGSQAMALRDIGIEFEHHKIVEFDKYAIKSYNAIHNSSFVVSDIREVHGFDLEISEQEKYCYFMTYSFPCQDLSKAGKQKGMSKESGTRSGLLWEVERILGELYQNNQLPQVLLMENVPDVIGNKNYADFMKWYASLEVLGYQSYYKILNAKDFAIPQNRNRCFMVSILGDHSYTWPQPQTLELRLKDMLEKHVDEKYYLSNKQVAYFEKHSKECEEESIIKVVGNVDIGNNEANNRVYDADGVSPTLNTMQGGHRQPKIICNVNPSGNGINGNIYDGDIAPTITTNKGEGIKILEPVIIQKGHGFNKGGIKKICPSMTTSAFHENNLIRTADGVYTGDSQKFNSGPLSELSRTLKAEKHDAGVIENKTRIRKLTPLECWHLMGFTDEDFYKAEKANSNSQLYKQAGNSIVKQVLMAIMGQLIPDDYGFYKERLNNENNI